MSAFAEFGLLCATLNIITRLLVVSATKSVPEIGSTSIKNGVLIII